MPIHEQNISAVMSELTASLVHIDHGAAVTFVKRLLSCPAIFVAGAGRSGLVMRCFAMRLMQMGFKCHVAGETVTPAITHEDILVAGSGSGETASLVAICRKAREKGSTVALVTAHENSACGGLADIIVKISTPSQKPTATSALISIQPLGSLFEQTMFIFLEAIVMELMRSTGQSNNDMAKRHANLE